MSKLNGKRCLAFVINKIYDVQSKAVFQRPKCLSTEYNIFIFTRYPVPEAIEKRAFSVHYCPGKRFGLDRILFPFWVLYQVIRRKIETVYTVYSYNNIILICGYFCKLIGKTWIADLLDDPSLGVAVKAGTGTKKAAWIWQYILYKFVQKKLRKSDSIIILKGMKACLYKYGINQSKYFEITNGADLALRTTRASEAENGKLKILYVGGIKKERGILTVINAAKLIEDLDFTLFLVGGFSSSKEERFFRELIIKKGLVNKCVFTGFVKHDEVIRILNQASICLYPFPRRPQLEHVSPIKVFEYMLFSKPVIATDLAGVKVVIKDGFNGMLVEPENEVQMAAAIRQLEHDKGLRRRLGTNAGKSVRNFSWEIINTDLLTHLRKNIK